MDKAQCTGCPECRIHQEYGVRWCRYSDVSCDDVESCFVWHPDKPQNPPAEVDMTCDF